MTAILGAAPGRGERRRRIRSCIRSADKAGQVEFSSDLIHRSSAHWSCVRSNENGHRGLAVDTIMTRGRLIARFVEFTNEYPWRWRPIDVDQFLAEFRSQERPIALSTLRTYSNTISMFCSYVCDSRYGWVAFCEKQFGDVPSQICFEWNTPQHTTDDAVPPGRRAFTKAELQHLFDVVDDFVDEAHRTASKRWVTALRDSIAFKVGYAYGLRRRELVMLDLTDFGPNPAAALRPCVRAGAFPTARLARFRSTPIRSDR